MKLLFLSPCIPSPNGTGWEQRAFHFLKAYSELFDITFVCCNFSGKSPTLEQREFLHLLCSQVSIFEYSSVILNNGSIKKLLRCFGDRPFFASASFDSNFSNTVIKSAEKADLIHVSRLELFSLVSSDFYSQKTILDLDECHFTLLNRRKNYHFSRNFKVKLEKILRGLDSFRIKYYQANAVRKSRVTFVSSETEKSRIAASKQIVVVPNAAKLLLTIPKVKKSFPKQILFVGNLSAPANIDAVMFFVEKIFSEIIARDSDCEFHIVGRQPSPEIIALTKHDKIKLTIDLPNLEEAYLNATIVVIPIRFGAGTKLKMLEAFGFGVPCVSTSIGCEGLSIRDKEHLLIADTPEEFAAASMRLLGNLDLQQKIADSAWRYVHQYHRPENIINNIVELFLSDVKSCKKTSITDDKF